MRYIGVDLHTTQITVCSLKSMEEFSFERYQLSEMGRFIGTLEREDEIAVEATGNTRWFVEQVKEEVKRVVIGEVKDFADEKKLASYFGIVPGVRNSNKEVTSGKITKRGNKVGRTTLVQCSLVAIRYNEYLRNYYERLKARGGHGKAKIAVARKFLGIIYHTLKNDWVFADFNNFELAK